MKPKRLLPIALITLMLSITLMGTATYAWFSINAAVKATGMSLSSTGPDNLLISIDTTNWANTVTALNITGGYKIYPSSSQNGYDFYAITDDGNVLNGDIGGILDDSNIANLRFQSDLDAVTTSDDGYYTSYTLYIKTLGTSDVDIYISDVISASSGEDQTDLDKCIRLAVFDTTTTDTLSISNFKGIYAVDETIEVHPVSSVDGTTASLSGIDPLLYVPTDQATITAAPKIIVPGGGTDYVKLTVNVWIEGQNRNCKNVLAGDTFQIDLKFDAVQPT